MSSILEIKAKIQSFCAYQERCQKEVREKLKSLHTNSLEAEQIIAELIEENFLNEQRFVSAFARGKFRIKKWGRKKIESKLKFKEVSPFCINKAMREINESDYEKTLEEIIKKRWKLAKGKGYQKKIFVTRYCISRGYEPDLIWQKLGSNEYS